jgi:hypothetical protein
MEHNVSLTPAEKLLHKCDNPACCRPDHLEVGTQAENLQDMAAKNRSASGERNARAKLTKEEVLDIRASLRAGYTAKYLATEFGVTRSLIHQIRDNKIWKRI